MSSDASFDQHGPISQPLTTRQLALHPAPTINCLSPHPTSARALCLAPEPCETTPTMSIPWTTVATESTRDGTLRLLRRAERDWLITLDGRVLMNSASSRSEVALGALACAGLAARKTPRVLVGGLGMGFTLRAVLDALPAEGSVMVAELNPVIVAWCKGPIAHLTDGAVNDPRVTVKVGDFARSLHKVATANAALDAVVIDLYVGPDNDTPPDDPLYGTRATQNAFKALRSGGVYAVWGETYHERYAKRLEAAGFVVRRENPARGSTRMVVYVATRP